MKFLCHKIGGGSATIVFAILSLAQPASAVIYDWHFTNENGNFGNPTDVVAGFVEFNDADVFPNATDVAATNLQITSVDNISSYSHIFGNDEGIELGINLVPLARYKNLNSFAFDTSEQIEILTTDFQAHISDKDNILEYLTFNRFGFNNASVSDSNETNSVAMVDGYADLDSSSLTFIQQQTASVPFEFSPTLGLLVVGGVFAGSRYIKYRKTFIK